jgi:uncharacterized protein YndB with AHSA1/START domain
MVNVEVEHRYAASRERVWDRYTDHVGWTKWAGAGKVTLDSEGSPERDGVGCVRRIANPGVVVREEVVEFDRPRRMVYRLLGGAPIADHEGCIELEELPGGGTRFVWRCRFRPTIPGTGFITRQVVTIFFGRVLRRLEAVL